MTLYQERCPTCQGKGTIVKDGSSEWEYDSHYPCPRCTTDHTADRGTGWVSVAHEPNAER
jgi:DnaJ-class molecular chaperone